MLRERISIASVTVAYNGAGVLAAHVDALKRQSRVLDEIVLVNNASTDGTLALLTKQFPEVTVLNQPVNSGVGGGYAAGLAYAALSKKYEWVWMLDQDSIPAEDGLERLVAGLQELGDAALQTAILAPIGVNGETKLVYPLLFWRNGLHQVSAEGKTDEIIFVDSVISSGTLIRREAVEKVGLPRADFFMDFVDHEYCLRLRRFGYGIAVVASSRLEHTLGDPRTVRLFGSSKSWTYHPPWRQYYMLRNEIFTAWHCYPNWRTKYFTLRRLLYEAAYKLLFGGRRLAYLAMIYHGFRDGVRGRLGIRFLPDKATGCPADARTASLGP